MEELVAALQRQVQQPALVLALERGLDQRPVFQHLDLDLDDLGAEAGERVGCCAHTCRHLRQSVVVEVVGHDSDAEPAHALLEPSGVLPTLRLDRRRVA